MLLTAPGMKTGDDVGMEDAGSSGEESLVQGQHAHGSVHGDRFPGRGADERSRTDHRGCGFPMLRGGPPVAGYVAKTIA